MDVDLGKVSPLEKFIEILEEDQDNFYEFLEEAKAEINFYDWCVSIQETYVGMFYTEIIGIFLFKIIPSDEHDIGEWVWVIVGDLPSAYILSEDSPNAVCALACYINEMSRWVIAAEKGEPVSDLIPVKAAANPENAELLRSRLEILDTHIVQLYLDDLKT